MICKYDCPIHSKCDSVNIDKHCVYNANWFADIKIEPNNKHW